MVEGKFLLRLDKSLWNKTASSSSFVGSQKKKSSYSSDECTTCGAIALAGQELCISCSTDGRTSPIASGMELTTSSVPLLSKGISGQSRKGGITALTLKSTSPSTTRDKDRKFTAAECSQLIEREIAYIRGIRGKIHESYIYRAVMFGEGEEAVSALGVMNYDYLTSHIVSLRIEPVQRLFRPILTKFMQHQRNIQGLFNRPVIPPGATIESAGLELKDYMTKIKNPMDLGTVRAKIQQGAFQSISASAADMILVFNNAMLYNPPSHHVHQLAKALLDELMAELKSVDEKIVKETERKGSHSSSCKLCSGEACSLCGEKCLKFESPVLLCHGSCMQRIKRNSVYYCASDGAMLWCQRCYSSLPQVVVDGTVQRAPIMKRNLLRCKSDEEVSEPWVECDTCHKWVHQVCGLYNDRYINQEEGVSREEKKLSSQNSQSQGSSSQESKRTTEIYECPRCKLEHAALESVNKITENAKDSNKELAETNNNASTPSNKNKRVKLERLDGSINRVEELSSVLPANLNSGLTDTSSVKLEVLVSNDTSDTNAANESEVHVKIENDSTRHEASIISSSKRKAPNNNNSKDCEDRKDEDDDNISGCGGSSSSPLASASDDKQDSDGADAPKPHAQWRASTLPRTRLSDFIESMVKEQLRATGFASVVPTVTVRMSSNTDQCVEVPEQIIQNFCTNEGHCLPSYFRYKQKCILLFQEVDGVDVCLFSLYVQEFGDSCPAPNKGVVYISYLDSVDYFRPVEARTMVYHEIVIAYLKWAQLRGFRQGHIWSCPPQRGDNFIFWCHPSHQVSLTSKGVFIYNVGILCHVECCIRQLLCSSIMLYNNNSIAHNHHTNIHPLSNI